MTQLKVKEFDNENKLVSFVNDNQIPRENIVLIEHLQGHTCYRLFWYKFPSFFAAYISKFFSDESQH